MTIIKSNWKSLEMMGLGLSTFFVNPNSRRFLLYHSKPGSNFIFHLITVHLKKAMHRKEGQ